MDQVVVSAPAAWNAVRRLRMPGRRIDLEGELLLRLERARSVRQIQVLCNQLGLVGSDRSLDRLGRLADDRRAGVPEAAIVAIGWIGTDAATSLLLGLLDERGTRVRETALSALAATGQPRARDRIMKVAATQGDVLRTDAIRALGEIGGDDVIELFRSIPDRSRPVVAAMVDAAATMGTDQADAFLFDLARDRGASAEVRAVALRALPATGDDERQAMLMEVVASGDPACAAAAAEALGHSSSTQAVSLLAEVAGGANDRMSSAALRALGEIGSPAAVRALGEIVSGGTSVAAQYASFALLDADTPESRGFLLDAARSSGARRSAVLWALTRLGGPEADALVVEAARTGEPEDRMTAINHLMRIGHPEASKMAVDLLTTGSRAARRSALYVVGDFNDDATRRALHDMARGTRGITKVQAVGTLAEASPADPEVGAMLIDMVRNGSRDEAIGALDSLGRTDLAEGRQALVAAMADPRVGLNAVGVVGQLLGDPEMVRAMTEAARSSPNSSVRQMALTEMLKRALPGAPALAAEVLQRGAPEEIAPVMGALGNAGSPDAQRVVRDASLREDPRVRAMAASALAQSSDPASSQRLLQLASDRDPEVRGAAIAGLGQVGSREAVDALVAATGSVEAGDRLAAVQALSQTEDGRANRAITELVGSRDAELALAAIAASSNLGREVEPALLSALESDDVRIRERAASALRERGVEVDDASSGLR